MGARAACTSRTVVGCPENLRPPYCAFQTKPTSVGPVATCARFHDCQCTSPWRAAVAEPTATAATATTAAAGSARGGARREPRPAGRTGKGPGAAAPPPNPPDAPGGGARPPAPPP